MKETFKLFKKYLPIIFILSTISLLSGLLALVTNYSDSTVSVDMLNVIPIMTILIMIGAIAFSIILTVKVDKIHIKRIKKDSGFSKFAAALVAALGTALFFFDFFRFVNSPSQFSALRILRLLVFVPFVVYMVITLIPKKIRRRKIELPEWLAPLTSIATLVWCILGLMTIYFYDLLPTTNQFKLIFLIYYVLVTLFFLFEIQFELLKPNHRAYIISSLVLFVFSYTLSGAIMFAKFLGRLSNVSISEFEIFLSFAIGLYAFSRMVAVMHTLKFEVEKSRNSSDDGSSSHRHHHHRHHHHHHTDDENKAVIDTEHTVDIKTEGSND